MFSDFGGYRAGLAAHHVLTENYVRTMSAVPSPSKANLTQGRPDASAVSQELVSITKAEHIELVMQANYWKSLHARAVRREQTNYGNARRLCD